MTVGAKDNPFSGQTEGGRVFKVLQLYQHHFVPIQYHFVQTERGRLFNWYNCGTGTKCYWYSIGTTLNEHSCTGQLCHYYWCSCHFPDGVGHNCTFTVPLCTGTIVSPGQSARIAPLWTTIGVLATSQMELAAAGAFPKCTDHLTTRPSPPRASREETSLDHVTPPNGQISTKLYRFGAKSERDTDTDMDGIRLGWGREYIWKNLVFFCAMKAGDMEYKYLPSALSKEPNCAPSAIK